MSTPAILAMIIGGILIWWGLSTVGINIGKIVGVPVGQTSTDPNQR